MKRLFPEWWGQGSDTQVHDEQTAREVACALLHEVERLTKSRGSELIVFAQHQEVETPSESLAAERVLSCLSDPATRVLDLRSALSELKAKDPSRYRRPYYPEGHMTAEGNQFVVLELSKFLTQRFSEVDHISKQ